MRTRLGLIAVALSVLLGIGFITAASATGGPPTIGSLTPAPVAIDGTLTISGTGCDAGSPVSFNIFDTLGGVAPLQVDSTSSGAVANASGVFSHGVALESHFAAGRELGVIASCTPAYDFGSGSSPQYVDTVLPVPTVAITAPATAGYGSRATIRVATADTAGALEVLLDGTAIYTSTARTTAHTFRLPSAAALGSHTLQATFDPAIDGLANVEDSAVVVIGKAVSRVALKRFTMKKVRAGSKVKLTVLLASTGPRVGKVVIKDGGRVRLRFYLPASAHGKKIVWVRLPTRGNRKLTASFLGNRYVKAATSRRLSVSVR